jgi:uncharacterized protein YdeI (YjbR/CyaY-like superfamily)
MPSRPSQVPVTEYFRELARKFNALSPSERQHYQNKADQAKQEYAQNVAHYESMYSEKQRQAYADQISKKKESKAKAKERALKRAELGPRPKNAYLFFIADVRAAATAEERSQVTLISKLAGKQWRAMSEQEKMVRQPIYYSVMVL